MVSTTVPFFIPKVCDHISCTIILTELIISFYYLFFAQKDHSKHDPLLGVCSVLIKKRVPCESLDDDECVEARRINANHFHVEEVECGTRREDALPVCFLMQRPRLLELFKSNIECYKQLALWRGVKKYILDGVPVLPNRSRSNLWDGDRIMTELLWFWDPNRRYMLPCFCELCGEVPSSKYVMSCIPESDRAVTGDGSIVTIPCSACGGMTTIRVSHAPGNPRNLVYKLHMDGWLQHGIGRVNRSVSSIELVSGCLSSTESAKTKNVHTLAFIPEVRVPKGEAGSNLMSAVISVIVDELLDLFIDGVDVQYNYCIPELEGTVHDEPSPATTTIRVMLVVVLADLPARAKLGQWKDGGMAGCYRCEAFTCVCEEGSPQYYYPGFLKQYHNKPRQKDRPYAEVNRID